MENTDKDPLFAAEGILIFDKIVDTLKAERFLKEAGYKVKAIIPPDDMCSHCELGVRFPLKDRAGIQTLLDDKGLVWSGVGGC